MHVQGGCTVVGASYVFNAPSGLAVDSNGNVYVADAVDSKVVVVRAP
jgi:DNA-binding beta-propeller fold protein YncE